MDVQIKTLLQIIINAKIYEPKVTPGEGLLTPPRASILDLCYTLWTRQQKDRSILQLALEILEKLLESPLLIGGPSGHLIEPTTSSRIAGHRSGFRRELMKASLRHQSLFGTSK